MRTDNWKLKANNQYQNFLTKSLQERNILSSRELFKTFRQRNLRLHMNNLAKILKFVFIRTTSLCDSIHVCNLKNS